MNGLRSFYKSTHWLWVISRIVVVLMFIYMFLLMGKGRSRQEELLTKGVWLLGTVLMAVLAIIDLARLQMPRWSRISAGVFMCLCSLWPVLIVMAGLQHGLGSQRHLVFNVVMMIVALWFLLGGVRDFVMR